jgi:hypothetical protein
MWMPCAFDWCDSAATAGEAAPAISNEQMMSVLSTFRMLSPLGDLGSVQDIQLIKARERGGYSLAT